MRKAAVLLALLLLSPSAVLAAGTVVSALRPQLRVFDDKGQPAGTVAAADLKLPQPIVAMGPGGSLGVHYQGKTVFLRGLDVQTQGVNANCAPVQSAARQSGSAYAATSAGIGSASDCRPQQ